MLLDGTKHHDLAHILEGEEKVIKIKNIFPTTAQTQLNVIMLCDLRKNVWHPPSASHYTALPDKLFCVFAYENLSI